MNDTRLIDVREILVEHLLIQNTLQRALNATDSLKIAWDKIVNAMIYCEKRQAQEIELLYAATQPATIENDCGHWTVGEYCQCEADAEVERLELLDQLSREKGEKG